MTKNVSEYAMDFVANKGVREVFFISGGGNRFLSEALAKHPDLRYICTHHEQSLSMAVEGYARMKGYGAGLVTTGPGVTNAITGAYGAYLDSTPCMFISGQVNSHQMIGSTGLRQFGVQEVDALSLVKPITKYAVTVQNPQEIKYHLERAYYESVSGRPGPVWLDIPLNVQNAKLDFTKLVPYTEPCQTPHSEEFFRGVERVAELIANAERPILYVGQGVRLAGAQLGLEALLSKAHIPVVSSWNGADIIEDDHPLYVGRPGMFGQRAANFAIQNSDLLITIGARLSIPQTGYNFKGFARGATKVIVDIDPKEAHKEYVAAHLPIISDARTFLTYLNHTLPQSSREWPSWLARCHKWRLEHPSVPQQYFTEKGFVNSYVFIDRLSDIMDNQDTIVTDMGTSFTGTYQAIRLKKGQRMATSSGMAAMGWGLPGAIGACFARNNGRTICISGDGGMQFNIQELQTVYHHQLPIKMFVINNEGYHTMRETQNRNFGGKYIGADRDSGVSMPDFVKVAQAYGIPAERIHDHAALDARLPEIMAQRDGPYLVELMMNTAQPLEPKLISKTGKSGKKYAPPLEDMAPFLSEEEMRKNMIIPLYEE